MDYKLKPADILDCIEDAFKAYKMHAENERLIHAQDCQSKIEAFALVLGFEEDLGNETFNEFVERILSHNDTESSDDEVKVGQSREWVDKSAKFTVQEVTGLHCMIRKEDGTEKPEHYSAIYGLSKIVRDTN